jgi:anthranilate synthase component 2
MILLVDNYDSFSYNLYQLVGSINPDIRVVRNDDMTVAEILALRPQAVILSPGPGRPEDAGICVEGAKEIGLAGIPVLGVCLGHQAICKAFGATVGYAKELMHGKQSVVAIQGNCPLFAGLPDHLPVARCHSLSAAADTIPDCLEVTAVADDGEIMAVQHREAPIYGVQFHPESILTPDGMRMLENFLKLSQ